jgi:hypothetical protein
MTHAGRPVWSILIERDKIGCVCVNQAKFVFRGSAVASIAVVQATDDQR